jgi:hypothetical protein
MPLIDLKTTLKSLKFGNDRMGGGSSNEPYERFAIPGEGATKTALDLYNLNRTSSDYPIRGGSITTVGGLSSLQGQIDKDRIAKFLKDEPKGKQFIAKQIGLQLSNPKMQTGTGLGAISGLNSIFGSAINLGLENTRIYNGGTNTLAQVLSSGTGIHIPRQGLLPIDTKSKYYVDTVSAELIMKSEEVVNVNRLLLLKQLKIDQNGPNADTANINAINRLGLSTNRSLLFQYVGGPGSTYGIGNTTIKRAQNTNADTTKLNGAFTMTYSQIASYCAPSDSKRSTLSKNVTNTIADFRRTTGAPSGSQLWNNEDGVNYRFYSSGVDKMNADLTMLALTRDDPYTSVTKKPDDLIKFGFECMSNDDPGQSVPLQFRAFLTKGISDNNSADLNTFKYMGRGETFYTYQGFQRAISFGFKIVVFSKAELLPIYEKLNYLVSQVYPDYSTAGYMRAPLVKVTIGDYLYRVPGFLDSVNVSVDNDASWELNLARDTSTYQLPKVLDVDIEFKPIMTELPKRANVNNDGTITSSTITGRPDFNNNPNPSFGNIIKAERTPTTNTITPRVP